MVSELVISHLDNQTYALVVLLRNLKILERFVIIGSYKTTGSYMDVYLPELPTPNANCTIVRLVE